MRSRDAQIFRHARRIRAAFRSGKLLAYATESCFGLGCDPGNRRALRRLLRLKRRPWHKGLLLVAHSAAQLEPYIETPSAGQKVDLAASWPGPHTWIIDATRRVPRSLTGRHRGIGVRVTAHRDAAAVSRIVRSPLVSTSANPAGKMPLKTYRACVRRFGARALIVPGRIGGAKRPSTIRILKTGQVIRR